MNTSNIPNELKQQQVNESFDIDFCEYLSSFINNDLDNTDDIVLEIVKPYPGTLLRKIGTVLLFTDLVICNACGDGGLSLAFLQIKKEKRRFV